MNNDPTLPTASITQSPVGARFPPWLLSQMQEQTTHEETGCCLLPTKFLPSHDDDPISPRRGTTETQPPLMSPDVPVLWKKMSVVEWVESLVATAEAKEKREATDAFIHGGSSSHATTSLPKPIFLGSTQMSMPSPIPKPSPWFKVAQAANEPPEQPNVAPSSKPIPMQAVLPKLDWNLEAINWRDPGSAMYTGDIMEAAREFESNFEGQQYNPLCQEMAEHIYERGYQHLPTWLQFMQYRIVCQHPPGTSVEHGEMRLLFNQLYEHVVSRLYRLTHAVRVLAEQATNELVTAMEEDTAELLSTPPSRHAHEEESDEVVLLKEKVGDLGLSDLPTPRSLEEQEKIEEQKKKEALAARRARQYRVNTYMMHWLRDNWIYPYEEDDVYMEMADKLQVTYKTIENWLVNGRSRNWRPTILKAMDMDGATDESILEDSLNLYSQHKVFRPNDPLPKKVHKTKALPSTERVPKPNGKPKGEKAGMVTNSPVPKRRKTTEH